MRYCKKEASQQKNERARGGNFQHKLKLLQSKVTSTLTISAEIETTVLHVHMARMEWDEYQVED
jgi:hypothetical protein